MPLSCINIMTISLCWKGQPRKRVHGTDLKYICVCACACTYIPVLCVTIELTRHLVGLCAHVLGLCM